MLLVRRRGGFPESQGFFLYILVLFLLQSQAFNFGVFASRGESTSYVRVEFTQRFDAVFSFAIVVLCAVMGVFAFVWVLLWLGKVLLPVLFFYLHRCKHRVSACGQLVAGAGLCGAGGQRLVCESGQGFCTF